MNKPVAVITGAARGIGAAITKRLIADGFFAIAVDLDEEAGRQFAAQFSSQECLFSTADISDSALVKQLMSDVIQKYHRLDVLVNNAGIIRDHFITNMSEEDFDLVIKINLKGTWLMCREAAQIMKEQQAGRIINISSRAWLGNAGQSNYAASKAGVVALTKVLALELAKFHVSVNAVAPGLIDTELTKKLRPEVLEKLIQAQPTRSMGYPEDVAHVVAFLASEKTQFITGQVLYVDGGKSIGAST